MTSKRGETSSAISGGTGKNHNSRQKNIERGDQRGSCESDEEEDAAPERKDADGERGDALSSCDAYSISDDAPSASFDVTKRGTISDDLKVFADFLEKY